MWWVPLAASAASALLSNGGGSGGSGGGGGDMFGGLGSLGSVLPGLGGGSRSSSSQTTNVSLAVNPVIANQIGGGSGIQADTNGSATGYPTSNANSSGGSGGYPTMADYGATRSTYGVAPYGDPTLVQSSAVAGSDGSMWLLLAGLGVAAYLVMNSK